MRVTEFLKRRFASELWQDWETTANPKVAPMIRKTAGRVLATTLDVPVPALLGTGGADEIDWERLPPRYVLKCDRGSATTRVFVMEDGFDWIRKTPIDAIRLKAIAEQWNETLIIEEFVEDSNGTRPPLDYKLFVFGEFVDSVMVFDRSRERPKLTSYDTDWKRLPTHMSNKSEGNDIPKPALFGNMLAIASRIGAYFGTFLRVDLYESTRGVLFGELCCNPCSGRYFSEETDVRFGQVWQERLGLGAL